MNDIKTIDKQKLARWFVAVNAVQTAENTGYKLNLKARSKEGIYHPCLDSKIYHDFSSMVYNDKIAIDSAHEIEVGYGYPKMTQWGLEIDAVIFENTANPQHESNRIIFNLKNNIPQEASIDFSGEFDLELSKENELVNGIKCEPLSYIVRNWTLRAVAICKEGQDSNTKTELSEWKNTNKNIGDKMENKEVKPVEQEVKAEVKAEAPDFNAKFEAIKVDLEAKFEAKAAEIEAKFSAKLAEKDAKIAEFEAKFEALKGIDPVMKSDESKNSIDHWAVYKTLSPSEKTKYFQAHRAEMNR